MSLALVPVAHTRETRSGCHPAAMAEKLAQNSVTLGKIDKAIELVESNPGALGVKNYAPDAIVQRVDPKGVPTRAMVAAEIIAAQPNYSSSSSSSSSTSSDSTAILSSASSSSSSSSSTAQKSSSSTSSDTCTLLVDPRRIELRSNARE